MFMVPDSLKFISPRALDHERHSKVDENEVFESECCVIK